MSSDICHMLKNQKYSKEEMYLAVEIWQESDLTKSKFCEREGIAIHTFKYWQKKYNKEKKQSSAKVKQGKEKFIPIEMSPNASSQYSEVLQLEITFPNGVKISCPANMSIQNIKSLIDI